MKLKNLLDIPCGIRFMFDSLDCVSSASKRFLLSLSYPQSANEIKDSYTITSELLNFCNKNEHNRNEIKKIRVVLEHFKEIENSIYSLKSDSIPDDIVLFELKSFAIISEKLSLITQNLPPKLVIPKGLGEFVKILDPENSGSTSFYIYDSYSIKLAKLRNELKNNPDDTILFDKILIQEYYVREELFVKLKPFVQILIDNYFKIISLDLYIARVLQIEKYSLTIPEIVENGFNLVSLFNPEVANYLNEKGKKFQKQDIIHKEGVLLITGANMGGKSILLKSVALTQLLCQFGIGIPAGEAKIAPLSRMFLLSGDQQDSKLGLSSFASEISRLNEVLYTIKNGGKVIALIDEPARSTNPYEGSALVEALIEVLSKYKALSIITTHYNIKTPKCARKRVKGIINGQMDYSLIDDLNEEVPKEALNVAKSLGADVEWIELAERIFNNNQYKL